MEGGRGGANWNRLGGFVRRIGTHPAPTDENFQCRAAIIRETVARVEIIGAKRVTVLDSGGKPRSKYVSLASNGPDVTNGSDSKAWLTAPERAPFEDCSVWHSFIPSRPQAG